MEIYYSSNYLKDEFKDLELDVFLASAVKNLISKNLQEDIALRDSSTSFIFDTSKNLLAEFSDGNPKFRPIDSSYCDIMICDEALYYNNRTNALHLRKAFGNKHTSNELNALFGRRYDELSYYRGKKG